jgi:hypothetical protein
MMIGKAVAALCLAAAVPSAFATEWQDVGPRAMGMGGVGVALPDNGPLSSYWNPGSLGRYDNPSGFEIPVGAQATVDGDLIQVANNLNQIYQDCNSTPQGPLCTQSNITNALDELANKSNGLRADANGGLDMKFGKLALFADNLSYAGMSLNHIDTTDTQTSLASPDAFTNNNSSVTVTGLAATEFGLGYGHEIPFIPGLSVGGNIKAIVGETAYQLVNVVTQGSNGFSHLQTVQSIRPGVDLGALWDLSRMGLPLHPMAGITARNINDPKFAMSQEAQANGMSTLSYQGTTRAGVSLRPFHWWFVEADADLTRNLTLDGTESQMLALGTEVNIFNRPGLNIPLRAGVSKNMADGLTSVSLGAGLDLLHVHIDAAATASPQSQDIQSVGKTTTIPTSLGGQVQVGVLFGGSGKDKQAAQ